MTTSDTASYSIRTLRIHGDGPRQSVGDRTTPAASGTTRPPVSVQRYVPKPVSYNKEAQQQRTSVLYAKSNIAVAYPVEPGGQEHKPVVRSSEHDESVRYGEKHAERLVAADVGVPKTKTGLPPAARTKGWISRLYTELKPCDECEKFLNNALEDDAIVEYTGYHNGPNDHNLADIATRAVHIAEVDFLISRDEFADLRPGLEELSTFLKSLRLDDRAVPMPKLTRDVYGKRAKSPIQVAAVARK
ncbi:hypothetical protein [Actinophytocola oryzae]|uniref:hypothetical protein n=1 Tax=Actinophytocola oryzae TaxID=502181 RepID=UPI0010643623|nr:hypothetical protein [Actinophytocola oryzae]